MIRCISFIHLFIKMLFLWYYVALERNEIMAIGYDYYESPIGKIYVVVDEVGVCKVDIFEDMWEGFITQNQDLKMNKTLCKEAIHQIDEYFHKKRKDFDLPLHIVGTEFRKKVWDALLSIPYGTVYSYQELAIAIGNPKAIRAVGQANKANQIPLIIPCHRVIGKNGKLVGFSGHRTPTQKILLEHEDFILK